MKKITILSVLIMAFVGISFVYQEALAANPTLNLRASKTSVVTGEEFTVEVLADAKDQSVSAVEIHIDFPNSLQARSFIEGSFLPVVLSKGSMTSTTAKIILGASPTTPRSGSGVLATLTMKALSGQGSPVQISFSSATQVAVIGSNSNAVGTMTPISISISGTAVTPIPPPTLTSTPTSTPGPTPSPTLTPRPTPRPSPTTTPSSRQVIKFKNDPRVYEVVSGDKIKWIPSPEVFNNLNLDWKNIQERPAQAYNQLNRVKLIRAENDTRVYYVTEGGLKRWIPSAEIFSSYGNKWEDIVVVTPLEIDEISDSTLVRVTGDKKVYKIESNIRKWITTAEAFDRNNFRWDQIAPVNQTELDYYSTGQDIN